MVLGKLDSYMQKNEIRPYSTQYTKIYSKCIKDLNVRLETIKPLKENEGSMLFNMGLSNVFLTLSLQARERKKINKWDLIKLKSSCTAKETINKTKMYLPEWEKIFANNMSDKGLISKIFKFLIQLDSNKIK